MVCHVTRPLRLAQVFELGAPDCFSRVQIQAGYEIRYMHVASYPPLFPSFSMLHTETLKNWELGWVQRYI